MADFNGFKKNGETYIPNDATARASISTIEGKIPNGTTSSNPLVNQSTMENALDGKADVGDVISLAESVSDIEDKIPSNASSSNQLATRSDVSAAYKPKGNATLATLPPLTTANLNNVYNMTEDFTTTADFAEGAGKEVKAGNEVGIINIATDPDAFIIKYTVLGGFIDLSEYATQASVTSALADKVDKIAGKGLSTNDYSKTAKGIVDNIQSNVIANTKLIKDTVGWSGNNKLAIKFSYIRTNIAGTWSGNTLTINDISLTFEVNNNGYVTKITGGGSNASADTTVVFIPRTSPDGLVLATGDYKANGTPTMPNGCFVRYFCTRGGSAVVLGDDTGNGIECSIQNTDVVGCLISVPSGKSINGLEFNLMLRDADILDDTYESYHKDVVNTLREAEVIERKNLNNYNATTSSSQGVTYTVNTNKTVSLSGTATANSIKDLRTYTGAELKALGKNLILNGGNANAYLAIRTSDYTMIAKSTGGDAPFDTSTLTDGTIYYETIGILSGVNTNGIVIKPMIRLATETDPTYEPYYILLKDSMFRREEQRVLGAKNLLKYDRKANVTEATITIDEDGVIDINGTVTTEGSVIGNSTFDLPAGNYILSGCTGGSTSTYCLDVYENQWNNRAICENGDVPFTFNSDTGHIVRIYVKADTYNHVKIKPMIRLVSDPDDTYVPYAMTNRELTEKVTPNIVTITYESGISQNVPNSVAMVNVGKIIILNTDLVGVVAEKSVWVALGTVSASLKPNVYKLINAVLNSKADVCDCQITNEGVLRIRNNSNAIVSTDIIHINGVYCLT